MPDMNDTIKRAVRSFAQGFVGILATILVPFLYSLIQTVSGGGELKIDVNVLQAIAVAAVAGGVVALVSFLQNLFEEKTGVDILPK